MLPTLLLAALSVSADPAKPPEKLVAAKAEYEQAVGRAAELRLEAIQKAAADYRKRLAEAQDQETKAGNLDAAIAIRDEIRQIDNGATLAKQVNTKADLAKAIEGRAWHLNQEGPITFKPNGVVHAKSWEKDYRVTWAVVDRRTVRVTFKLTAGSGYTREAALFVFSESLDEYTGFDSNGTPFKAQQRYTAPPK